jgi:IS1 family transposase
MASAIWPIFTEHILVNNLAVEKQKLIGVKDFFAHRPKIDYRLWHKGGLDVEILILRQKTLVGIDEPATVYRFLRKTVHIVRENTVGSSGHDLRRRPAFVCNSKCEHSFVVWNLLKAYREPRALRIYNGLSIQEGGMGGIESRVSLPSKDAESAKRGIKPDSSSTNENPACEVFCPESLPQVVFCLFVAGFFLFCGCSLSKRGGWSYGVFACSLNILGLGFVLLTMISCNENGKQECEQGSESHNENTVSQKYLLTIPNYCITVLSIEGTQMANILPTEKKVAIVSALAEGSGIRQIERMTGVHRDTIMRLGVKVGKDCANLLDAKMRDLSCEHLQIDELWGFIGKKQRHIRPEDSSELGDVWTFCAIDRDTKFVPSFKVGKRDAATANTFVSDLASRLKIRTQLSSDALPAYVEAVEQAFGANVDFAQVIKVYENNSADAEVIRVDKLPRAGRPNLDLANTSHVERLNGTTRLHMRRLTGLTYAFSKKLENFEAAVGLHFAYYNFVKRHNAVRCTPAMAAGIEKDFWTVGDLVEATA